MSDSSSQVPIVADAPSPWTVLHEYTKTVVTVSLALLTFSVSFQDKLVNSEPSLLQNIFLWGVWIVLILAIIFALISTAGICNFLRDKDEKSKAILCSNISFFLLALSAIGLLGLGATKRNEIESPSLHKQASSFSEELKSLNPSSKQWVVVSMTRDEKADESQLIFQNEKGIRWAISSDYDLSSILTLRQDLAGAQP